MLIDLTFTIDKDDPHNPFFHTGEGIKVAQIGHLGTHMDIMLPEIHIDPERFICNGTLVHVENIFDRQIEPEDFSNAEIHKGDFVIFKTDWFTQYYKTDFYLKNHPKDWHPELSDATLQFLVEKEVNFIGIDAAGVKKVSEHAAADLYCAKHNIFVIENVVNLNKLSEDKFKAYCFPLKLQKSSGLPTRILAEI
ncbi:cyclase family protein [Anaerosinus massiliensis]|uniref:cyclase family protein n=1 Tax=Massilibacillus massiliensis TaxID=1806837 RepID=UPI000DA62F6E|nr:cyclase family protein [Massilibacillus massiliensis]